MSEHAGNTIVVERNGGQVKRFASKRFLMETMKRCVVRVSETGAFERLFDAFAGHDDQPEVIERQYFSRRTVAGKSLLQSLRDLVPVAAVFHVDEVQNDDPAQVAKPDLPR